MTGLRVTSPPPTASKTFSFKRRSVCAPDIAAAMAFINHEDESPTNGTSAVGSKRYTLEPSPSHRARPIGGRKGKGGYGLIHGGLSPASTPVSSPFAGGVRDPVPLEDAHSSSEEDSDGEDEERKGPAYVRGREPPNAVNSPRFHGGTTGAGAGSGAGAGARADSGAGSRERKSPQQAEAAAGHRSLEGGVSESKLRSPADSPEPHWNHAPLPPT